MTNTNKIYDGDVKARVGKAIEAYKAKPHCYFNDTMHNCAQDVKNIAKIYKTSGWMAVAILIKGVNENCWAEHYLGQPNVSEFYAELYHAACAWYQGYPANEEEEKNANPEDGSFDHVSEEDLCRIYKYLD